MVVTNRCVSLIPPHTHTPTHLLQGKTALNFLYAKPPGMAEAEAQQAAAGDDEAVKDFYRKYVYAFTQTHF